VTGIWLKRERVGHPKKLNPSLGVDLLLVSSHRKVSLIEKNGMVTIRHDLRLLGIAAILRLVVD